MESRLPLSVSVSNCASVNDTQILAAKSAAAVRSDGHKYTASLFWNYQELSCGHFTVPEFQPLVISHFADD